MPIATNRQVLLRKRPVGAELPDRDCWEFIETRVPEPADGEFLVRNLYASIDPAMRGWIRPIATYVPPVGIGAVMRAGTVGRVVESRHEGFRVGDYVACVGGALGLQDFAVCTGQGVYRVDPSAAPLECYVGGLGLNGFTAYFGLLSVGRTLPSDTVVVSSAAGATGSVVAQIAKILGCRTVGIAGGPQKSAYLRDTLGLDASIDYKSGDLNGALAEACPDGIDVFFDNVGGSTLDAVLMRLRAAGRVVVCGAISQSGPQGESVRMHLRLAIVHGRMEGFIAFEYEREFPKALAKLTEWYKAGRLKLRTDLVEGLEAFPDCLRRLFAGEHFGKLVLKLADDE
jgi:NADPH-dependent curcumin reductase CurA